MASFGQVGFGSVGYGVAGWGLILERRDLEGHVRALVSHGRASQDSEKNRRGKP